MCEKLNISRTHYYRLLKNPNSKKLPDMKYDEQIIKIFKNSRNTYGCKKISERLKQLGIAYSPYKVLKVMKRHGLKSSYHRPKYRHYTVNEDEIENKLNQQFSPKRIESVLVSDLTSIKLQQKRYWICFIINLSTREIVGHSISPKKDVGIVLKAFDKIKQPLETIDIFHTDRGSEFKNFLIENLLIKNGISRSLSKKGNPYDNAVSESTFNIFKREFKISKTSELSEIYYELNSYVKWFNEERIHSTLNYLSPLEYKNAMSL